MSLINFLKENRPESTTRLTLFISCIVVHLMCLSTMTVFFITDGKTDYTNQCALLSGLLLSAFVTSKIISKGKENPSILKE